MKITPRLRLATTALALTALLAACGDSTEPAGAGSTATTTTDAEQGAQEHNEDDAMFAQMMIVHHEGAIEMAQLAQEQAVTPEVQELAGQIEQAQGPEIELMQSWLQQWGEPAAADDDMAGMDHGDSGGMEMDGMSQEEAMAELQTLSGEAFDARFLELMIEHHRGAVTMAQTALDEGQHPDVQELAEKVVTDQEAEIEQMEQLHKAL
jgi:uncharacterized protein (DUF305 family)